jgi:hypothetical protein
MKKAKDMTDQERIAALDEIKRAARTFEPMPTDRKAAEMTEVERQEWLREYKRRTA